MEQVCSTPSNVNQGGRLNTIGSPSRGPNPVPESPENGTRLQDSSRCGQLARGLKTTTVTYNTKHHLSNRLGTGALIPADYNYFSYHYCSAACYIYEATTARLHLLQLRLLQ